MKDGTARNEPIPYKFLVDEEGVTAIEYGLLASLIAVVCLAAFQATGTSLAALYATWSAAVAAAL